MKKNIYTLFALGLFCFFSCEEDNTVYTLLTKAERLMEQSPDSILVMLQQIETPEKLSDKEYALWCLLLTQAEDKNYIQHSSDSLIKIAIDYYEKLDDNLYLMKSYYYAAVVYHEIGDSPRAQEFYLKALSLARELKSHAFLGRIYSNLGILYIDIDLLEEALKLQKEALKEFSVLNDSINTGIVLRNTGWVYAENGQIDSGIVYYRKAIPYVHSIDHFYIYNEIGSLYKQIGDYDRAFSYARLAQNTSLSGDDLTPVFHNLGSLYRLTNQRDSALFYLSQCMTSSNPHVKMGAYLNLAYLEEQQQNWQACVTNQQYYLQIKDSLTKANQIEKVQRIQSLYNYQQIEKECFSHEQDANRKKFYLYQLSILFIIILMFFLAIILYFRWKKRRELEKHEKMLRIEQQKYLQTQAYLKEKEDRIKRLEESILLYSEKYNLPQSDPDQFYLSPLYKKMINVNSNIKETDWEELATWIDILFPGFHERLKVLYPTINSSALRLCDLKKLNIPVKNIANLLFMTSQGVSHKWKRLYVKITGSKGSTSDMDSFIVGL